MCAWPTRRHLKIRKSLCSKGIRKYSFPHRTVDIWNRSNKEVVTATNIQWYLLIGTPFDSNTSQFEHIWLANFDLQSEHGLSFRTQTQEVADAVFPPVSRSCLRFSDVNTSLYCDSWTAFKSLWPQPWSLATYHPSQCDLIYIWRHI